MWWRGAAQCLVEDPIRCANGWHGSIAEEVDQEGIGTTPNRGTPMAERGLSADCRPHQGTAQESGDQSLGQTTEVTAACSRVLRT